MKVRAVRGATTVSENSSDHIVSETKRLLEEVIKQNQIRMEDMVSVFFTSTQDLNAAFPAKAARELGWTLIPLMGAVEADVPNGLSKCIRIMIHFNTDKTHSEIKHVFLNDAIVLRPDLIKK